MEEPLLRKGDAVTTVEAKGIDTIVIHAYRGGKAKKYLKNLPVPPKEVAAPARVFAVKSSKRPGHGTTPAKKRAAKKGGKR